MTHTSETSTANLPSQCTHTAAPTARQTRSRGPTEITSLFNQPSPPDAIQRKPATMANPVNTFTQITNDPPSQEDNKVASITISTRLYKHSTGTGSGLPSSSGIQSENSAFSTYLRDSRMQPSELYIPDSSGDTLATRTTTRYGHLHNGHKAFVVKIELFMPYFDTRQVCDQSPQWRCVPLGQRKQHQTIGPPGRYYPSVSGYSEDACPDCHQYTMTHHAKQISVPQLIKVITDSFKGFCQDPLK